MSNVLGPTTERFSNLDIEMYVEYDSGLNLRDLLLESPFARIRNFPISKHQLADFCTRLGPLQPAYRSQGIEPADMIGDVCIRSDLATEDRHLTEDSGPLRLHTARSWGVNRPTYFGLLMIEPGWRDQPYGMNGESVFAIWRTILENMSKKFPGTFDRDLDLLTTIPLQFGATHLEGVVADEPIVFEVESKNSFGVRFKENMPRIVTETIEKLSGSDAYLQAFERFNETVQDTKAKSETVLESGDLVVFDNRLVAHGRYPFLQAQITANDEVIYNPRHMYNVYIDGEAL